MEIKANNHIVLFNLGNGLETVDTVFEGGRYHVTRNGKQTGISSHSHAEAILAYFCTFLGTPEEEQYKEVFQKWLERGIQIAAEERYNFREAIRTAIKSLGKDVAFSVFADEFGDMKDYVIQLYNTVASED